MKHIEKIIINNARRLGENIEIDFGSGATIILAPNGTGKTTIFEAVELVLTGQIKRLEDSPDAIIRNGLSQMTVRLNFSQGKYCQVNYARGGVCNQRGHYTDLFEVENKSSLPYLFRLTHFLEQRTKEWFVDKGDKDAGNLLSRLPLGKDLQNIISKKTSLLRAIGITETSAENNLSEAEKKLSEFEELITKRNGLATETALTPLKKIVEKLLPVSKLIGYENYGDEFNVALITVYFERIRVLLNQEKNMKNDLIVKFNALKERTRLYVLNQELLCNKQTVVSQHVNKIAELGSIIEQTKREVQNENEVLSNIKVEIKKLNSFKSMFEEVERKSGHIAVKNTELEQVKKDLSQLEKSLEETIGCLKNNERLRDQYKLVDDAIKNKKIQLSQIEMKNEFQKQWQNLSIINHDIINIKIPAIKKRNSEYSELKLRWDNEVSEAEKAYMTKKNYLESINKASSTILDAVGNIRKHMAENQSYCPVCQAKYEPGDLINRIEASLNTLNPAIPLAIIEEKRALETLEFAKEQQGKENQKLFVSMSELNIEINKLEVNQKKILESFFPQFPGLKTPEEADLYIKERIQQITSHIRELEVDRGKLKPMAALEEIDNARLKKSEEERLLSELTARIRNLQNEIISETLSVNSISESLGGKQKEIVLENLSSMLIKEEEKKEIIYTMEATLLANEAEINKYQDSLLVENEAISKIRGIQEGIYAEWEQAGLEGQPKQETLKIRHESTIKSVNEMDKVGKDLNVIEQELANWCTAEKYNDIDNEVKKQMSDVDEEVYIESLKTSVAQKNSILQNINEKRNAINLLFANIMSESEQIHEQLNAINEPWKMLLKRIVINPLISGAPLLSNTTSRNKPVAKTSAVVHNQNISIANIASEAQLTDLQLTLMLSLTNRYQWTPWKALLLDEPTQHHDLVHASSVYDVLRDYIIDFDYQVMMSTHDSIQAKYFHRKLENEGVPSKIYQLVTRRGGVNAERIV